VLTAQLAYQARLLLRTPRAAFGGVLLPLLLLALRGGGSVAGLAVLGLISTAYVTHAAGLVAARESGVLKRWRATPLPPWCLLAARLAVTVALAVAGGAVTVLVGVVLYGASPAVLTVLPLGAVTWASLGTAVSALVPTAEAAWPVLGATYVPVVLLSGGVGSPDLPDWLAALVRCLPAAPLADGSLTAGDAALLTGWAAAGALLSLRLFRWLPRR
jgi:ABC-2 type transport system permease protein